MSNIYKNLVESNFRNLINSLQYEYTKLNEKKFDEETYEKLNEKLKYEYYQTLSLLVIIYESCVKDQVIEKNFISRVTNKEKIETLFIKRCCENSNLQFSYNDKNKARKNLAKVNDLYVDLDSKIKNVVDFMSEIIDIRNNFIHANNEIEYDLDLRKLYLLRSIIYKIEHLLQFSSHSSEIITDSKRCYETFNNLLQNIISLISKYKECSSSTKKENYENFKQAINKVNLNKKYKHSYYRTKKN